MKTPEKTVYHLFKSSAFYPRCGGGDYVGVFDSLEDAQTAANNYDDPWLSFGSICEQTGQGPLNEILVSRHNSDESEVFEWSKV